MLISPMGRLHGSSEADDDWLKGLCGGIWTNCRDLGRIFLTVGRLGAGFRLYVAHPHEVEGDDDHLEPELVFSDSQVAKFS